MEPNYYMRNLQKLLYMAGALHRKGFENLRIIPSVSPSGVYWRCVFLAENTRQRTEVLASSWIQEEYDINSEEIEDTIDEIAAKFIAKESAFLHQCRGENKEYVKWFKNVLQQLGKEELPYAFSDYFTPTSYWKTSEEKQIDIIPGEEKYNW